MMMIYLCSSAAALTACLAAQSTAETVGLLTTAAQPPADVTVRWAAVATVPSQPATVVGAVLLACTCVVVTDPPASADDAHQGLCAAIRALAAHGTTLIFAADAAPLAGYRPGMVPAALLPDTIIATALAHTPDPATLSKLAGPRRLLVLEGASYVAITLPQRTITVHGSGCALVITLPAADEHEPTRLIADVLTAGMTQQW